MMRTTNENLEKTLNEANLANLKLTEQNEQLNLEMKGLNDKINEHINEIEKLKSCENETSVLLKGMTEKLMESQSEKENLVKINQTLHEKCSSLEKENQDYQKQQESSLENLKEFQDRCNKLETNYQESQNELVLVRQNLVEAEVKLASYLADIEKLKENETLMFSQNESFLNENNLSKVTIEQLQSELKNLGAIVAELNEKNKEIMQLNDTVSELRSKLAEKLVENESLLGEIEGLKQKIKEIDRLKQIESVIQSQHWEEFGTIAETMKSLTKIILKPDVQKSDEDSN